MQDNTTCCNQNCRQGRDCPVRLGTHKPAEAVHQIADAAPTAEETHMRELTAYRTTVQNLKARLAEESARTAAEKLRADQLGRQHDTQAALNRKARAELAEMKAKAQSAPQAAPAAVAVPEGWALVPLEATQEMIEAWGNATELPEGMAERSDDEVNAYAAQRDWKAMLAVAPAVVAVPDERSAFEAWAESVGLDHLVRGFGKQDDYAFVETRRMWEAWQGRAALAATPAAPAAVAVPAQLLERVVDSLASFAGNLPHKPADLLAWEELNDLLTRCATAGVPAAAPDARDAPDAEQVPFLQESDQHLLHRFIETTEDDESYDIGKDGVKRLAELGVISNHGFGRYSVTMFGYWAHEQFWHQNPGLPLKTNADRDHEARAAIAAQVGKGVQ